jgi:IS30 family transposase
MAKKGYHHVTCDQRYQIQDLLSTGISLRVIGQIVWLQASTISREVARNSNGYGYNFAIAEKTSKERRSAASSTPKKMTGGGKRACITKG